MHIHAHVHRWWKLWCTVLTWHRSYRDEKKKRGKVKPRRHSLWSSRKWCLSIFKERTSSSNITRSRIWTAFLTASRVGVGKLVVGYARLGTCKLDGPRPADWGNTSSSCLERRLRFATKRGDLWGVSTGGVKVPLGFPGVVDCRKTKAASPATTITFTRRH